MTATVYRLRLTWTQLGAATDMLRYDAAFAVENADEAGVDVLTLGFTPERWGSFGVSPEVRGTKTTSAKIAAGLFAMSGSFINALRLAGEIAKMTEHHGYLVEGRL